MVRGALEGFNGTIMCYGQTGGPPRQVQSVRSVVGSRVVRKLQLRGKGFFEVSFAGGGYLAL